ncbi:MAG: hypothetical protein IJ678_06515 [Kiritimatiellae bacterium]|nr:hypothetical protein [Kiritimatiellia bacterium]
MADTAKVTLALDIDRGEFTKGISDVQRQLQGLAKQPLSFRERLAGLGTGQRVGIGGGIAVGAIDFLSSGLRLAGVSDEWTKSLSGAATSAKQFGTMLAPLGPLAAGAGTAIGAAVGALKGYTDAHVEAQKRLREIRQSFVDASASEAIAARRATTDEEKAERQHAAREQMADLRIKLERGATISDRDVMSAAMWDRDLASKLLDLRKAQGGKAAVEAMSPLANALWALNDLGSFDALAAKAEEERAAGRYGKKAVYTNLNASVQSLGPELLAALQRGSGFSEELDALYAQLHAPKGEEAAEAAAALKLHVPGRSGSLRTPQADALSAAGLGYTGNPMQETESLLREISANTRRMTKGAIPTVAA